MTTLARIYTKAAAFPSIRQEAATAIVAMLYFFAGYVVIRDFLALPRFIEWPGAFTQPLIYFSIAALCFAAGYFNRSIALRAGAAAAFVWSQYITYYDPANADLTKMFTMFALLVVALASTTRFAESLHAARLVILSTYLSSGLLKLWAILYSCSHALQSCSFGVGSALFAESYLDSGRVGAFTSVLVEYPLLALALYACVVALQIGLPLLYVFDIGRRYIGYELILFHTAIFLAMGIAFFDNIIVILLIFVLAQSDRWLFGKGS